LAIFFGGGLRDSVGHLADAGKLGPALTGPATGYGAVYHLEILVLFAALIVIGPLVRGQTERAVARPAWSLNDIPQ
jgi:BCD family chlorophyll transporter-like MFS transporter